MAVDTVNLLYGPAPLTPSSRLVRHIADPRSARVSLDVEELRRRHGSARGELSWAAYATGVKARAHWHPDWGEFQYSEDSGFLRLRASLPKIFGLLQGDPDAHNDRQLTIDEVHAALGKLNELGSDFAGVDLNLRQSVPTRLDIYYQWEVESVAETLAWIEQLTPPRTNISWDKNHRGGRTLYWNKGKPISVRFYDKGAETLLNRGDSQYGIDRLLRIELQSRKASNNLVHHEDGYRASSMLDRYAETLKSLSTLYADSPIAFAFKEYDAGLDEQLSGQLPSGPLSRLGLLYLSERLDLLPAVKQRMSESTYHSWKNGAKKASLARRPWLPVLPAHAFGDPCSSLWAEDRVKESIAA